MLNNVPSDDRLKRQLSGQHQNTNEKDSGGIRGIGGIGGIEGVEVVEPNGSGGVNGDVLGVGSFVNDEIKPDIDVSLRKMALDRKVLPEQPKDQGTFGYRSSLILDGIEVPIIHMAKYIIDVYDVKNQFARYVNRDSYRNSVRKLEQHMCKVYYDKKINDAVVDLFDFDRSAFMGDMEMIMRINKELFEFDKLKLQRELESVDSEFRHHIDRGFKIFIFMMFNYTLEVIAIYLRQNRDLDDSEKKNLVEYSMNIMDKINRYIQKQIKVLDEKCNVLYSMLEASQGIRTGAVRAGMGIGTRMDVMTAPGNYDELQKKALIAVAEGIPEALEEINMRLSEREESGPKVSVGDVFDKAKEKVMDVGSKIQQSDIAGKLAEGVKQGIEGVKKRIEGVSEKMEDLKTGDTNYCYNACDKVENLVRSIPSSKDIKERITSEQDGGYNDYITTSRTREYSESVYKNIDSILSSNDYSDMQSI